MNDNIANLRRTLIDMVEAAWEGRSDIDPQRQFSQ